MQVEQRPDLSVRQAIEVMGPVDRGPLRPIDLSVAPMDVVMRCETVHVHEYVIPSGAEGPRGPGSTRRDAYFTRWTGWVAWSELTSTLYVESAQLSDTFGRPLWRHGPVCAQWDDSYARQIKTDLLRLLR